MNMTDAEYAQVQQLVISTTAVVCDSEIDLQGFLQRINRVDTIGPILDPTLWKKSYSRMEHIRGMAAALARFKRDAQPHLEALRNEVMTDQASERSPV